MKNNNFITRLLFVSIIFFCFKSCKAPKPVGTINYDKANELEELFKTSRSTIINNHLGYQDSREVWFSIDRLKKYIAYVESQAKKKNYDNLGLRIYFGTYPENNEGKTFSTVFLVPTCKNKTPKSIIGTTRSSFVTSSNDLPDSSENENIYDIEALNFGGLGHPPRDYDNN